MSLSSDQQVLWRAYCEAGDYFSRLGGTGRYAGFNEYHIPGLVLILAVEKIGWDKSHDQSLRGLLPPKAWTETDGLPERIMTIIDNLQAKQPSDLREFVEYISGVYQKHSSDEFAMWTEFLSKVGEVECRI